MHLESRGLAANTINRQLAAVRRLAHEAADSIDEIDYAREKGRSISASGSSRRRLEQRKDVSRQDTVLA
jgi:hypothetical protein